MRFGHVKPKTDYGDIARNSVKKDFSKNKSFPEKNAPDKKQMIIPPMDGARIAELSENCEYAKFAKLIVNRKVKLISRESEKSSTGYYEFCYDSDRKALNSAAGWSDKKTKYLFTRPKFK